jgi:proline iminopeptidase
MRPIASLVRLVLPCPLALAACERPLPTAPGSPRAPTVASAARGVSKDVPPSGYVTTPDGVRLFYRIAGRGPDTVVVLHGGPGLSMRYLVDDLAPLAPSRTLIFYDQRGGGASDLPEPARLTAERMVADLETVRQHFGLARLTLLGHSWGGALAALYATRHPDRVARLVLLGPGPSAAAALGETIRNLLSRFSPAELAQLGALNAQLASAPDAQTAARCEQTYTFLFARYQFDPVSVSGLRGGWCSGPPAAMRYGSVVTGDAVLGSLGPAYDLPGALARTLAGRRVPTLVVEGAASPFVNDARTYAAAIPAAEFVLLRDAGHFGWLERPHDVFHAVHRFLETTKHLGQ